MSTRVNIAKLERDCAACAKDYFADLDDVCKSCVYLVPLLKLARAANACSDAQFVRHPTDCSCRWCVLGHAVALFDFGTEPPP